MATIYCNIDNRIKSEAIDALKKQGSSLNDAIQLFVTQIALNKGIPLTQQEDIKHELKNVNNAWIENNDRQDDMPDEDLNVIFEKAHQDLHKQPYTI